MIRLPALAIDANSPAIILGQSGQLLTKLVTLRLRQIDPVPLGEYSQQENWHIGSRVEGDHSIATALPLSTAAKRTFLAPPVPGISSPASGLSASVFTT